MKVVLDPLRCEGYGVCVSISPDVFALDDEDEYVRLLREEIDDTQVPAVKNAVAECPMAALRLID